MNTVVAKNVRTIREIKHWTQQHLADTAGIQVRTVQRVEKGDGASLDTLGALSNAFDVSIDFLQIDFTVAADQLRKEEEAKEAELKRTHDLVDVTPVFCSADLAVVGQTEAYLMHCAAEEDAAQDAFAALESNLKDIGDLWSDADPQQHREWLKSAYEQVVSLNEMGVVVSVGKRQGVWRSSTGPMTFRTLYVVAWLKGEERDVIAVESDRETSGQPSRRRTVAKLPPLVRHTHARKLRSVEVPNDHPGH